MTGRTFCIGTLGCRVNQTESDGFREILREAGYREVAFGQPADVVIVHTCTVTHTADAKSRQTIHRGVKAGPEAIVVVSGCYAQTAADEIAAMDGVDIVLGTRDRGQLLEYIEQVRTSRSPVRVVSDILREKSFEEMPFVRTERTRAFMKIQEGCQQFCTYCIIPFARGPVRSRDPRRVLEEAQRLAEEGFREVVLTGIHTGAYGQDLEGWDLARLLGQLRQVTGFERIRVSSLDPNEFTGGLLDEIGRGMPLTDHFHISLQSGSDPVLERMRRAYDTRRYRELLERLRDLRPGLAVTTDVMVGFPGETGEQHHQSLSFVEEMGFSDIHVFPYSPRSGTRASTFPDQVPEAVKQQRMSEMLALKKVLRHRFRQAQVGLPARILVEKCRPEGVGGHTEKFLWAEISGEKFPKNTLVDVIIRKAEQRALICDVR